MVKYIMVKRDSNESIHETIYYCPIANSAFGIAFSINVIL